MTKLSDTQAVILNAASQRKDLSVLPLPETLKLKGGALTKVMDSLRNKGLIRSVETDGRPQRVVLTSEGMAAIGVAPEDEGQTTASAEADTAATPADAGTAVEAPAPATEADGAAMPAKRRPKAKAKSAKPGKAVAAEKPTPRTGTKQARMIEMLKRPQGATVEQIAEATGWQHHTIRGAISGAPSSGSTRTVCSAPAARAGARTCRTPATSHSSRCSGSRSTSCSAACPRAARRGSSRTVRCRTDRPAVLRHLRRRGLAPGGDLFMVRKDRCPPA
jgi:hypothetical protein